MFGVLFNNSQIFLYSSLFKPWSIANLNSIHFGSPQHKKTKTLLRGVVHGIGGYGNCMGVPTIAGQTSFDESYNGNILVNAMTLK